MNPRMSDEQTWIIATALPNVPDRQLAIDLGVKQSSVHARRWTIRRDGWTCRVRFVECLGCGQMMTLPPTNGRTDRPYHPECHIQQNRAYMLDRYHQLPEQQKQRSHMAARDLVHGWQEGSIHQAVNRGAIWTESEDAFLEANQHRTARELAEELGRTFYGVAGRLKRVKYGS